MDNSHNKKREWPLLKSFISGGVGGMCLVFAGQPFDLIKVRLQTATHAPGVTANDRPTALSIGRDVVRREGVRGLYRGMAAPLAGVTPIFALCFWAYEAGKELMMGVRGHTGTSQLSLPDIAVAGALSAVPTTLIMAPGERIKVLLQVQGAGRPVFKGPGDVVRHLYRTGGLRSIFAGSAATLARDGSGSMAYFSVYEGIKRWETAPSVRPALGPHDGALSVPPLPPDAPVKLAPSPATILVGGGLAGMANWLVALPIDTIKSRIQAQAPAAAEAAAGAWKPPSMLEVGRAIVKAEGVRGLYRGLAPALLRAFPANAACFGGMEASRAFLDRYM